MPISAPILPISERKVEPALDVLGHNISESTNEYRTKIHHTLILPVFLSSKACHTSTIDGHLRGQQRLINTESSFVFITAIRTPTGSPTGTTRSG